MSVSESESLVGKIVDGYRLTLELTSNPFSRTYLGESTSSTDLRKSIAFKYIHSVHFRSTLDEENFLQEAGTLKQLSHPSIQPIVMYGIQDGVPYIATEFESQTPRTLHVRMRRQGPQPFPLKETFTIISQVGRALHYTHQQHLFHGDLRPRNVRFNANGDAFLSNFLLTSLTSISHPAIVVSDSSYLAPEQLRGVTWPESDQYALACIAYTMLIGHQPFPTRRTSEPQNEIQRSELFGGLHPPLPEYITHALSKALQEKLDQRYETILDFLAALQITEQEAVAQEQTLHQWVVEEHVSPQSEEAKERVEAISQNLAILEEENEATITALGSVNTQPMPIPPPSLQLPVTPPLGNDHFTDIPLPGKRRMAGRAIRYRWTLLILACVVLLIGSVGIGLFGLFSPNAITSPYLQVKSFSTSATDTTMLPVTTPGTVGVGGVLTPGATAGLQARSTAIPTNPSATSVVTGAVSAATASQTRTTPQVIPPTVQSTTTPQSTVLPTSTAQTITASTPTTAPQPTPDPTQLQTGSSATYSFESDTSGWSVNTGQTQISTAQAEDGSHSLLVTYNTQSTTYNPYVYLKGTASVVNIKAGETISAYVYVSGSATVSSDISLQSNNGTWYDSSVVTLSTGSWYHLTFVVPPSAPPLSTVGVDLYCTSSSGNVSVYIDHVSWS